MQTLPVERTMTDRMRAAVVDAADGAVVVRDVPIPAVPAGHALVRVAASALNPLDTKIRAGKAAHARHPFPAVLGMDMAGIVAAVADDVGTFRVGDAVYGLVGGVGGHQGTLADYVAVDADLLAGKPAALSFREAAALPLAAITAWEGLVDRAAVARDEHVLVLGGAGAVGQLVVQIAIARGARVVATASPSDFDYVRTLGATPMDYARADTAALLEASRGDGFDVVYDTVGGETLDLAFTVVRVYSGRVVSCLGWGTHRLAPLSMRGASYSGVFTLLPLLTGAGRARHGEILREVAALADAGAVRARLDPRTIALDAVGAAYDDLVERRAKGKLVVDV